jgi:general secretion pathway protein G
MKFLFLLFALMVSNEAVPAAEQAPMSAIYADIHGGIKTMLDAFAVDCGRYPTTAEGFKALLICPTNIPTGKWHGPYLDNIPQDVWKHDYVYRCPGIHNTNGYDLYSCGFDGISKSGGGDLDDINNWDLSSPHGGNDYALNYSDVLIYKFVNSPVFPMFRLTLLIVSFLGGVWMIAAIFFQRVRDCIARHPIVHFIWFAVSLPPILLFLSVLLGIVRLVGR